jgi:hypothetical protein
MQSAEPNAGSVMNSMLVTVIALGSAVLVFVVLNFGSSAPFHAMLLVGGLLLTYFLVPQGDRSSLIAAYIVAYALRLAAVLWLHSMSPTGLLMLDDIAYDQQGRAAAANWSLAGLQFAATDFGTSHIGYPLSIGWLYATFGGSVLSAKLLNAFAGALTIPLTYLLTREITPDPATARIAAWLMALFIYDVLWAGFLLKDTVLLMLFSWALLSLLRIRKPRFLLNLTIFLFLMLVLTYFRFYTVGVVAAAILVAGVSVLAGKYVTLYPDRRLYTVALLLMSTFGIVLLISHYADTIGLLTYYTSSVEQINSTGSTFLEFKATPDFALSFAKGAVVYMLGPFAWVFHNVDWIGTLAYPGMYLVYACLPFFLIGCIKLWKERRWSAYVVLYCFVLYAVIEIFVNQSGERQRMMSDGLFVICAAIGWRQRAFYKKLVPVTYAALLIFALLHISGVAA